MTENKAVQRGKVLIIPQPDHDIKPITRYLEGKGHTLHILETVNPYKPPEILEKVDVCLIGLGVRHEEVGPVYRWLARENSVDLIGLCERAKYEMAAEAVEQGVLYDYVIIKPLYDIHQVGFAVQRALKQQASDRAVSELLEELEMFRNDVLTSEIHASSGRIREKLNTHIDDLQRLVLEQQRTQDRLSAHNHLNNHFQKFKDQKVPEVLTDMREQLYSDLYMSVESSHEQFQSSRESGPLMIDDEGPLVLIVDDDEAVLRNVGRILRVNSYRVVTAGSGEEGVLSVEQQQPDVILMDIQMPVLTGIEAVRAIRQLPDAASIPVIMTTAYATEEFVQESKRAGANDYIVKPFRTATLIERIQRNLHDVDMIEAG